MSQALINKYPQYKQFIKAIQKMNDESLNDKHIQMVKHSTKLQQFIKDKILKEFITHEETNIDFINDLLLKYHDHSEHQIKSYKKSIKLSTTKLSLLIYLHNGNKAKVIEKKLSLNKKHLDLLESLEDGDYQLALLDGNGDRNYFGDKTGENYRQFAESIRKFNIMISNCEKCFL